MGCDVLHLPVGVEGDEVEASDRLAVNLGGVVLDESVVAPGPAKLKSWRSYSYPSRVMSPAISSTHAG